MINRFSFSINKKNTKKNRILFTFEYFDYYIIK